MLSQVRLKLSPPWVTYVNKLKALFGEDPEINIVHNADDLNDEVSVYLYVDNQEKADALSKLLPITKCFGNVLLNIYVVPPNATEEGEPTVELLQNIRILGNIKSLASSIGEVFNTAFKGNPAYAFSYRVDSVLCDITYIVFKNCVVQFFNDNLNDLHGNLSTLYQDIAAEIFEDLRISKNVFFCTDVEHKVGKPLGEWP